MVSPRPCESGGEKGSLLYLAAINMLSVVISLPRVREIRKPKRPYPGHPGIRITPAFFVHPSSSPCPSSLPCLLSPYPRFSLGCVPLVLMSLYQSPELFLARCSHPEGLLKASRNYYHGRCQGAIDLATCDSLGKEG